MKTVALWIDVQKAVIVSATEQVVDIEFVSSAIDSCRWQSDVWKVPPAVKQTLCDDQLKRFYQSVSGNVLDAQSLLIFGRGDAKSVLRQRLRTDNFPGTVIGFEAAGRMSESQLVTKVKNAQN